MELDAGWVGGIVHKGVHAGLIFSTEGEDYGESISFLEDRLGFQWNRVIAAVGGAAILLGRKHVRLGPDFCTPGCCSRRPEYKERKRRP